MPSRGRQIANGLVVTGVTEIFQHRSEVFRRQQFLSRPGRQPTPGEEQKTGGPDIVARPREQHGTAQRAFILDAAGLLRSCRSRRKRQPLPPGAGPSLLPADHPIERADGGAGGERDVLNAFSRKALRIGNRPT
ncbi:hypothetical protein X737_39280 [Mesorhizobium sp. L48C026A00]|nr:hypothetical protein X737_39280 [Mesorhizobium sp. L48C026A00]